MGGDTRAHDSRPSDRGCLGGIRIWLGLFYSGLFHGGSNRAHGNGPPTCIWVRGTRAAVGVGAEVSSRCVSVRGGERGGRQGVHSNGF